MRYTLQNGTLSVDISTKGAELKSIQKDGVERLWQGNSDSWAAQAPVLFPICGCLKDGKYQFDGKTYEIPNHGFARLSDFSVEKQSQSEITLLLLSNEETKKMFPFDFAFRVHFGIKDETLSVTYSVENTGKTPLYFSVGGHEGQACPGGASGYSLHFDCEENLNCDLLCGPFLTHKSKNFGENTRELRLTTEMFDFNTLIFRNLKSRILTLQSPRGKALVTLNIQDAEALLVWTRPEAEFICLEAWNGLPDFVDSSGELTEKAGIIKLSAHETCKKSHHFTY